MKIFEEMERQSVEHPKESTKDMTKESEDSDRDDYFEHPEGGLRVNTNKLASNEEGKQMSEKEDAYKLYEYYEFETSDQNPKEEQLKQHAGEEMHPEEHCSKEGKTNRC